MKIKRAVVFVLIAMCVTLSSVAQQYMRFYNVSIPPNIAIYNSISQDSIGLIWIGSDNGLCSFDGYALRTHFEYNSSENTKIHCSIIRNNILYLGSNNGLLIYDTETNKYVDSGIGAPYDIRSIQYISGKLWLGSIDGLYIYDTLNRDLQSLNADKHFKSSKIYTIQEMPNEVLVGTYDGLYALTKDGDYIEQTELTDLSKDKSNIFVNTLLFDKQSNNLWIGTEGMLYVQKYGKQVIKPIKALEHNSIKTLAVDESSTLYVGTDNGLFTLSEDEVAHYVHDSRDMYSLSNNVIWVLFKDKSENIWIGTERGISLLRNNNKVEYIPIHNITNSGIGNDFHSIFKDVEGNYWLGGNNGLIRTSYKNKMFSNTVWFRPNSLIHDISHGRIRDIYQGFDGNIWVASDGSVNLYDRQLGQFDQIIITDSTKHYNANWSYDITENDSGTLFVGSYQGGLLEVNKDSILRNPNLPQMAEYSYNKGNGLLGDFVSRVKIDSKDNIWVLVHGGGVNKITRDDNIHSYSDPDGYTAQDIVIDGKDNAWVGFNRGLARISDGNKVDTVLFNTSHNLEVFDMKIIGNHLWIASSGGIWITNMETLETNTLGLDATTVLSIYWDRPEDRVVLGGVDQLIMCPTNIATVNNEEVDILIRDLYVNNQPLDKSKISLGYTDGISLKYYQNNLRISLSELPYMHSRKNVILYKLEGLDANWNVLDKNTNVLVYDNLKSNHYRLKLGYIKASGEVSAQERAVDIIIKAPWYLSFYMLVIYLVLLLSLAFWLVNFFRVKERLQFEQRERERILRQSTERINFLRDWSDQMVLPLNMIITPVSRILDRYDENTNEVLRQVHENALSVDFITHKLMNFERVEKFHRELIVSRINFLTLVEDIINATAYNDIQLECSFDNLYVEVDVLVWRIMITNILSNAIKYGENSSIVIMISYDKELLCVKVIDRGIGISEDELPFIAVKYFQSKMVEEKASGLGLYTVKNIVELLNGKLVITSELGKGTEVGVEVPISIENTKTDLLAIGSGVEGEDEKFISKATKIVEEHMDDPQLNVSELCSLYDINYKKFYRTIKQITGQTPVEFIKTIRLKKASVLLQNKDFNISEVMYMVGFSNSSYFSKCFKLEFGLTPIQYREQFLN